MPRQRKKWRIDGWDGTSCIFKAEVPRYLLNEQRMQEVLRRLVCRHLTEKEILDASFNRSGSPSPLLDILPLSPPSFAFSCGVGPYYTARIVDG